MYNGHLLRPFVPLERRSTENDGKERVYVSNGDAAAARLANAMTLENRQVSCNAARMV